jgi:hypothetical protein
MMCLTELHRATATGVRALPSSSLQKTPVLHNTKHVAALRERLQRAGTHSSISTLTQKNRMLLLRSQAQALE